MNYILNELEMTVPEPMQDRSVNVLIFGNKQPPELNLVISRDFLPDGEKFDYIVKKQLDVISAAQEDFKQVTPEKQRDLKKADGSLVQAKETTVSYKAKGNRFFQRHLYIPLGGKKIMIMVATTTGTWEAKDEASWERIVGSVKLK